MIDPGRLLLLAAGGLERRSGLAHTLGADVGGHAFERMRTAGGRLWILRLGRQRGSEVAGKVSLGLGEAPQQAPIQRLIVLGNRQSCSGINAW